MARSLERRLYMAEDSEPSGRPENLPSEGRVSILLVDDRPANLLALEAILGGLGHDLVQARSGEEALRRVAGGDFALVLLDVQMPGMDGFETARLLRGREDSRRTPIIFLSAFDSDRFPVEEAYSLGAVDYLVKPLSPVILRAKVAGFVDLFEKTRQVKRQAERLRQVERRGFERKLAEEDARLRESEARKAAILETALDCIITINHEGRVVEFNPAAERLFGYAGSDVRGRDIGDLIVPASLREAHRRGMGRYLSTGEGPVLGKRIEMPAVRADGTEVPVELAITRIPTGGPPMFTAYLRDISDRTRVERHRNARLAVTQILTQAATVPEAATGVLRAVCEGLGWDLGFFWTLDPEGDALRCLESWHRPDVRATEFEATSRRRGFARGEGLPGHVWATGEAAWVLDVVNAPNFPRAAPAAREGLHGAFGCPVVAGSRTLGVMEFFSRRVREPDPDLLEMMGTVAGQVGHFVERKRAEEQLRESERRFARFMHHLPGLAWVKDSEGRYVYANDAAERAFRTPRAELYGKTDAEIFGPETAAQFEQNDRRASASGAGVQVVETLADGDGVLRHSLVSKFPMTGPDGGVISVGGMAVDITDRLRAEEALRATQKELEARVAERTADLARANEFLKALLENIQDGIVACDAGGVLTLFNRATREFHGLPEEPIPAEQWAAHYDLYRADGKTLLAAEEIPLYRALRGEGVRDGEMVIAPKGGRPRTLLASGQAFYDDRGAKLGAVVSMHDITQRKEAEEALHQARAELERRVEERTAELARANEALKDADRRKDEFLATLAHELRNPLAPIRNSLQILKMPGVDAGTVGRSRDMMERQVHHLVRLVDDLLDVSRVMRGKIELRRERVELASVVARAVETVQPLVDAQGHRLGVSLPDESLPLDADPVRLAQVVGNLLTNAAKYTEPGGHIRLTAEREGDEAVLRVRDDGIGIAPEVLPRVFDLFVQVDHAATRSQGGLGIGLTLVKNLVEMHGGSVDARSAGLGRGSEFVVRLPISAHGLERDQVRGEEKPTRPASPSGLRLLVVDDNHDAADSLAMMLRLQGHEVRVAHSGPAALEAVEDYAPDVVFLDIGMPGMDGHEVARRMRRQPGLEKVVLAALTGWGQQEDRRRTTEAGFDHHLVKPPEPKAVESVLAQLKRR
jgi:PAS domain S-box-containing protein